MISEDYLLFTVGAVALVALIGFFFTKEKGYGRFATSALLLLLAISFSSLLFAVGKLEETVFGNIIFAVIGFAGGLFTTRGGEKSLISEKSRAN